MKMRDERFARKELDESRCEIEIEIAISNWRRIGKKKEVREECFLSF